MGEDRHLFPVFWKRRMRLREMKGLEQGHPLNGGETELQGPVA